MDIIFGILCLMSLVSWVSSSVSGISYMDPLNPKRLPAKTLPGEDPCNPLYWYPRQIPEYCYNKIEIKPVKPRPTTVPTPMLPPVALMPSPPMAIPVPYPMPYPMPMFPPVPQFVPSHIPQFVPLPEPQFFPPPIPKVPSGFPLAPTNPMMPMPMPGPYRPYTGYGGYNPFPQQAGLVPGIPGVVAPDGGINILPFSDAYSDMLEKHKQKVIRKRLQKVLDDYEDYPRKRKNRRNKKRYF